MSELTDMLWVEKYRPKTFADLVMFGELQNSITEYLKHPESLPSFIFYSSKPGTGKTSTAKIIAWSLGADLLSINASDERGIDVIRNKIVNFCQTKSSNPNSKRCVFLDEADGLTKQAQESMKALMETYSKNAFFILSCNDIGKIIEPIRKGRSVVINFENPPIEGIIRRLQHICIHEKLKYSLEDITALAKQDYPDIRSMILTLQQASIDKRASLVDIDGFNDMMKAIKDKKVQYIYERVYSGKFDIQGFVRYYFRKLFEHSDKIDQDRLADVAYLLADIEKSWNIGANLEIVFLANVLEIIRSAK
jgi:replication factor C small subunit